MMELSDAAFRRFSTWMREQAGIHLPAEKKPLLQQRLLKRLRARQLTSYEAYFQLLLQPAEQAERVLAVDLLTTHETYFFREPEHFNWLRRYLQQHPPSQALRIWSAACSSGEEVWSLAMLLADERGLASDWHITGSDISQPMLERARAAHYPMQRIDSIPPAYLQQWCLKGVGTQDGTLLIDPVLRPKTTFTHVNLAQDLPHMHAFHIVFLRNVLIYFDQAGKAAILQRILHRLAPQGYLVVSHSESLQGLNVNLRSIQPGVYRKSE
ncbi:CheR family methyltransferase [Chitinilyticum litopenaei]|uniref:CheR family methyltransferase n=1 Tax=Chitinilyticum litopenaei TaxID=1121276 RepID=UPI0005BE1C12|nr:CheR family methyltransferase [Chitinilyticum litopenaei]